VSPEFPGVMYCVPGIQPGIQRAWEFGRIKYYVPRIHQADATKKSMPCLLLILYSSGPNFRRVPLGARRGHRVGTAPLFAG